MLCLLSASPAPTPSAASAAKIAPLDHSSEPAAKHHVRGKTGVFAIDKISANSRRLTSTFELVDSKEIEQAYFDDDEFMLRLADTAADWDVVEQVPGCPSTRAEPVKKAQAAKPDVRSLMIAEIVTSERNYASDLDAAVELFLKPLKRPAKQAELGISSGDVDALFGNLGALASLHHQILADLEAAQDETAIFNVFSRSADFFKIYASFVSTFDTASQPALKRLEASKAFAAFEAAARTDRRARGLPLPAFLIMPVQRVPRYVLLLSGILKLTPADHKNFKSLSAAAAKVSAVADHLNECKRQSEKALEALELQRSVDTAAARLLAAPHRRLIRRDCAKVAGSHRAAQCALFNDMLVWLNAPVLGGLSCDVEGVMDLSETRVAPESLSESCLLVTLTTANAASVCQLTPASVTIEFASIKQKRDWLSDFRTCAAKSTAMRMARRHH